MIYTKNLSYSPLFKPNDDPMLLAIDIGNSNITAGFFKEQWQYHWRLVTQVNKTPGRYEALLRSLFRKENIETHQIEAVVVSSVVPHLNPSFDKVLSNIFDYRPTWVSPANAGIKVSIDNPNEIGTDLLANAVAGYAKSRSSCIVVDFGTALSMTVVGQQGDLLGVSIAPGLGSALKSLTSNTAQLSAVSLVAPKSAIGKNTTDAIRSGIVLGYLGLVEHLLMRIKAELEGDIEVVATGGMVEVIAPLTNQFDAIDPWLTLDGLRLIYERNQR